MSVDPPASTGAQYCVDVDDASFATEVIERSRSVPVLVDFWAPWCAPCRALGPRLERLAAEAGGRFILAKLNTESAPGLAARFAIRSIPAVKLFVDGEVTDEFAGALPDSAIRTFLHRNLPSPAEPARQAALAARDANDLVTAIGLLRTALAQDPAHEAARLDLVDMLIEAGALDEAAAMLEALTDAPDAMPRIKQAQAALSLARRSASLADPAVLRERLRASPDDHATRLELAHACAAQGDWEAALSALLEVVRRDRAWGDDAGRRAMIDLFLLVPDESLVRRYRSELAAVLNR